MINYINGNKFAEVAHFVISPNKFNFEILRNNAVIFCKTDYLDFLFNNLKFASRKYILITHASDYTIDQKIFSKKPNCIIKWFAENAEYNRPDLIPIPIGLENTENKDGCGKGSSITYDILEYISQKRNEFLTKDKIEDKVLCAYKIKYEFAHNTWINPWRSNVTKILENRGIDYFQLKERLPIKNFIDLVSDYRFVISPRGNGLDIHSVWETLYVGSIPIVIGNNVWNTYNLPILKIKKWEDLTYDRLHDFLEEIKGNDFNNYEQLFMTYWRNKILNEFEKLN